jgi:hypothetical protein
VLVLVEAFVAFGLPPGYDEVEHAATFADPAYKPRVPPSHEVEHLRSSVGRCCQS